MKISEPASRYRVAAVKTEAEPPTRITVRLKPELARRVDEERRARKLSATAVIEQALTEHLSRKVAAPKLTLLDALRKHGVLGSVDLGPDASINYKADIGRYLDDKHGPG